MAHKTLALQLGEKYISCAIVEPGNPPTASVLVHDKTPQNLYTNSAQAQEDAISQHIQKMLKDGAIASRNISLVIPDTRSYTRIFEMPSMTEKELVSAIKYQADQFIPIPIDKVSMDIDVLWEDKQNKKQTILLVAAANLVIERVSLIMERAGLVPLSLENETSASLKLFSLMATSLNKDNKQNPTLSIFLNFGIGSTSICLYDNSQLAPLQIHNFPLGLDIFQKEIKTNYSLSDQDTDRLLAEVGFSSAQSSYKIAEVVQPSLNELISQIQRFIISAKEKTNTPISGIYIYGEGVAIRELDARLTTLLGIKASVFNPAPFLAQNNVTTFFKGNLSPFVTVIGSSLGQSL